MVLYPDPSQRNREGVWQHNLWFCDVLQWRHLIFWGNKRSRFRLAYVHCAVHMKCIHRSLLMTVAFKVLTEFLLFMLYVDHGVIAVIANTTYMTINECSTPSSPEMMIIIDHNTNAYVEWCNNWGKPEQAPHTWLCCGICLYTVYAYICHTSCSKSHPARILRVMHLFTNYTQTTQWEDMNCLPPQWWKQGRRPFVDLPLQWPEW